MSTEDKVVKDVKKGAISYAKVWGSSSLPPITLATLVSALHARPFHFLPMLFPPVLLFSTYINLSGNVKDSAGITASWSALYLILASRRNPKRVMARFGARGLTRGAALGLAGVNALTCGATFVLTKKKEKEKKDEKVV